MKKAKKENKNSKVFIVKDIDELNLICQTIKEKYIVIVNVNAVNHKARYIDFLTGFVYALGGKREKLEENIFSFQLV